MQNEPMPRRSSRHLLAGLVTLSLLAGCAASPPSPPSSPEPSQDPRVLGSATAPVTIIEFTDLQCPYCARFALDTWPQLKARYVDTGKVRFASRDLPLPFHAYAVPAAVAARCAGQQGKFFEYREALFRGQGHLPEAPYEAIAARFGLDVEQFKACRQDKAVESSVRADATLASANGISSTPSFVIGREVDGQFVGDVVSGAQPFEVFSRQVEALLKEAQQ